MALKDIKSKIAATNRTHKVTRAMEAVSAVKMRKTQEAALAGRSYARAALSILARLSGSPALKNHPLMRSRAHNTDARLALVVITSDKGLAGALNSGVLKRAVEAIGDRDPASVTVYAYGKKGEEYFRRRGYGIADTLVNKGDYIPLETMELFARELIDAFLRNEYDKVYVVYNNFKSTFEQEPVVRRLLPLSLGAMQDIVTGIVPTKGKWSEPKHIESPAAYTFEPEDATLFNTLLPRLVAVAFYHMLLESKASEHSARMVAMKNASDKSKEVTSNLTRLFNKIRQAAITREVSEIISGREALAS